jgi:hypothetical protein
VWTIYTKVLEQQFGTNIPSFLFITILAKYTKAVGDALMLVFLVGQKLSLPFGACGQAQEVAFNFLFARPSFLLRRRHAGCKIWNLMAYLLCCPSQILSMAMDVLLASYVLWRSAKLLISDRPASSSGEKVISPLYVWWPPRLAPKASGTH